MDYMKLLVASGLDDYAEMMLPKEIAKTANELKNTFRMSTGATYSGWDNFQKEIARSNESLFSFLAEKKSRIPSGAITVKKNGLVDGTEARFINVDIDDLMENHNRYQSMITDDATFVQPWFSGLPLRELLLDKDAFSNRSIGDALAVIAMVKKGKFDGYDDYDEIMTSAYAIRNAVFNPATEKLSLADRPIYSKQLSTEPSLMKMGIEGSTGILLRIGLELGVNSKLSGRGARLIGMMPNEYNLVDIAKKQQPINKEKAVLRAAQRELEIEQAVEVKRNE